MNINTALMILMRCNKLFVFSFFLTSGVAQPQSQRSEKNMKTKVYAVMYQNQLTKIRCHFHIGRFTTVSLIILRFGKMAHLTQFYGIFV